MSLIEMETEVRQFVLVCASNPGEALALCAGGDPVTDAGANDRWFIYAASFGFGATASHRNCSDSSNAWAAPASKLANGSLGF
jgi:hypothetical protein